MRKDLFAIFLDEGSRHLEDARALIDQSGEIGAGGINELFRHLHSVKGMAASLGFDALMRQAHAAEEEVAAVRGGKAPPDERFRSAMKERIHVLRQELGSLAKEGCQDAPGAGSGAGRSGELRAPLPQVRLDAGQLDALLELVMRLSISQQRLEHALGLPEDRALLSIRDALGEAVAGLRLEVLELRLLPIKGLLPLLEQALRRWAEQSGVLVAFSVTGDELLVDRNVLEQLLDPLGHLLRNAVAHGLEPRQERLAAGKEPRGRIELRIRRQRDHLTFEVIDDGRGLDPASAVERAVELGLLESPPAEELGEAEALGLLIYPGMSGRRHADHLAGRGVGLAAVHEAIRRLGGEMLLDSRPGKGFGVKLRIPTSVAVLDGFLLETGNRRFALPVSAVQSIGGGGTPDSPGDSPSGTKEISLARWLGLELGEGQREETIMLLEKGARTLGVRVGRIIGRQELLVRPLGPPLDRLGLWTGAAVLPEGGLALVIDPEGLLGDRTHPRGASREPACADCVSI